jgi:hypothetical protein
MNQRIVTLVVGAGAVAAFAFWIGRSSNDVAQAKPALVEPTPSTIARAEERARIPAPRPTPAPTLARRPPEPSAGLGADLVASDPKIRRAAVLEVAWSADPDPKVMLIASRDSDAGVARTAMTSLGKLYEAGQVPIAQMIALATDRSITDRVRIVALNGLGVVPNSEAADVLVKLLGSGDTLERRSAAALLGNQDPQLAVPALIRALGDSDEYVRSNALESLRGRSRGRDFGTDAGAWQAWWQAQSR